MMRILAHKNSLVNRFEAALDTSPFRIVGIDPGPRFTHVTEIDPDLSHKRSACGVNHIFFEKLRDWIGLYTEVVIICPDYEDRADLECRRGWEELVGKSEMVGRIIQVAGRKCHKFTRSAISQGLIGKTVFLNIQLREELIRRYRGCKALERIDPDYTWSYAAGVFMFCTIQLGVPEATVRA